MTLSRQLMILIATVLTLLFLGTLAITVNSTRGYLESQLASHAQDAATSLGLSASAHVDSGDEAMVTTMLNAMFHRGDYLDIRFEDLDGQTTLRRSVALEVEGVPAWFRELFPLQPPQRDATMMSGWQQVGTVKVTSHPGLAYGKLWATTVQTFKLFLIGAGIALLAAAIGLRLLLRPLKAVEAQAHAICEREFPVVERRPFTLELRRVVEAMNSLSKKVSRMLSESESLAAELRSQTYQDPVTGLANRRLFMDVLAHRVGDRESFGMGGLLMLQLKDFKDFNQTRGYQAGDELLLETGKAIAAALDHGPRSTLAHLSGADFAVLIENADEQRLHDIAHRIDAAVAGLYRQLDLLSPDVAHMGGVVFDGQDESGLLAEADMALREAQRAGANQVVLHRHAEQSVGVRSASEWRKLIETALAERHFYLLRQPVIGCADQRVLHHEVFLRMSDPDRPDETIVAAVLMPMAESVGLSVAIDKAVVMAVIDSIAAGEYPQRAAVNLSPASLAADGMLDWLVGQLASSDVGQRMILEFPEYGAATQIDALSTWIERLRPLGVQFSLDQFGKGFTAFAYLRSAKVNYLKVDGSFVRQLAAQDDNRFFLRTVADIAHGLDMRVIAESVESEPDWRVLQGLGIDGGRGFYLGELA